MAAGDQLSRVTPYLERLFADAYVQDQLSEGIAGLRKSRQRAKGQKAKAALEDQRLWHQVQDAVASLTKAFRAVSEPEPPPRHRLRWALLLSGALGAGVFAWAQRPDAERAS